VGGATAGPSPKAVQVVPQGLVCIVLEILWGMPTGGRFIRSQTQTEEVVAQGLLSYPRPMLSRGRLPLYAGSVSIVKSKSVLVTPVIRLLTDPFLLPEKWHGARLPNMPL
jgi:hypothetical protein